jgi:Leucine rich repeat
MSKRKRERHILTFNRHRAAGRDDDDDDDDDSKKDPFEIDEEDYHNVDIVLRGFSIYNQHPDRSSTSIIDNRVTCSMDGSRVTHLKADSRSFLCSHRDASYIFSSDIGRLEALEFLSLASGTFDSIPDEIGNLVNLRVLDLENCGLVESLPTSIQKLKNLEKLVLCHTSVDCLPETFGSLSKLKYLDIGFTCIILLPSTFRHLTQLEYLNLSSTPIYSLPSGFQQLVNLKNLIMFDCIRLSKFPSSIGKLESLEKLSISFSHFQEDADEDVLASLDNLLDLRVGRGGDDPEFIYRSAAKLPDMSKVPKITTNVKNLSAFNPATYNDCCVDELHVELCFKGYTVEGEDEDEEDVAHLTNIRETVNCLQHLRCWHNLACLELGLFCESFSSGIHLNYVSVDLCHCHSAFRLNGSFFQSLPNLTLLRILNHEFPQMYPRVRWEEISCLKKLQSIALIGCLVVADPGMVATLPQLTNIEIRDHCDDINPEVLTCLDAPALNSLELNGCSLSNNDLQEIQDGLMTRCPLLGTLVLDHNPGIDTLPTTLSTGIRELSILHTRLQCNPDETLIRIAKENPGFVCVGCCTENSEFNRQLGMNRARALVLEREEICRLLWPRILQNASKAFSCRECAVDKRCTFCDAELSNADAIFHLLKLRGAADIFSDRLEDGKRRSKRDENSKRTLEPRPGK